MPMSMVALGLQWSQLYSFSANATLVKACYETVVSYSGWLELSSPSNFKTNTSLANLVIHQAPFVACLHFLQFLFWSGRTNGRTPCVKLMDTYWPGPGGSKIVRLAFLKTLH